MGSYDIFRGNDIGASSIRLPVMVGNLRTDNFTSTFTVAARWYNAHNKFNKDQRINVMPISVTERGDKQADRLTRRTLIQVLVLLRSVLPSRRRSHLAHLLVAVLGSSWLTWLTTGDGALRRCELPCRGLRGTGRTVS
jgi:hypothetical protein